jgi:hypothetical protein
VHAIDLAGNVDATPATFTWEVISADSTPPETSITAGPSGSTTATSATFAFVSSESGTFECAVDALSWSACTSPASFGGLAPGSHTFGVRARDAAGNVDPSPAERTWWIARSWIANGGFEGSLAGWAASNATLGLSTSAVAGSRAATVTRSGRGTFSIASSPPAVGSTEAGLSYAAGAWLRSDRPGRTVCLRLRERAGATVAGSAQTCLTSTSAWQQFAPLAYRALGSGRQLELDVYQASSQKGDTFSIDEVSLSG